MKPVTEQFENYLQQVMNTTRPSAVRDAMEYSLLDGGKRVRPLLLFYLMEAFGKDPQEAFAPAAALEMIHTYSLIHDDLPCMDDDSMRRGKPSSHVRFGEATALLAGDALLTKAFETIARDPQIPAGKKAKITALLSEKAGADGMIYGQILDLQMSPENADRELLLEMETGKTSRLIQAPLAMAAILAGREEDLEKLERLGEIIGIQFQVQDDLLELTSEEMRQSKSTSDIRNDKPTYPAVYGLEESRKMVERCTMEIDSLLDELGIGPGNFRELVSSLKNRKS